jgi:hypothetical protein
VISLLDGDFLSFNVAKLTQSLPDGLAAACPTDGGSILKFLSVGFSSPAALRQYPQPQAASLKPRLMTLPLSEGKKANFYLGLN